MSTNQLQVETRGSELILTRQFNAPREKVFKAHTACEHINNWWGPREWPLTYCKMDFRVGGKWHFCMSGPDGMESWGLIVYQEIKAPELIAYVDHFSDKDSTINTAFPSTTVRTEFIEQDGKTMIRSTAQYNSPEDLQKVMEMGMVGGITETFDRLEEFLVAMK